MTVRDVIEVLDCLEQAGIHVWVDGGWGVDALVGEQTRDHSDLDLALDGDDLEAARQALEEEGFNMTSPVSRGFLGALYCGMTAVGRLTSTHLCSMSEGTVGSSFPRRDGHGVATR
jgi:lincosamide nucleotidyltransferase A/C/D/E